MSPGDARLALCERLQKVFVDRADHVAVREHDRQLTFAEFGAIVTRLQEAIAAGDDGSAGPVGLLLERSALAYASMWACIGLGRAYVPLNTSYPRSRLRDIVEQAKVTTVVCDADTSQLAHEIGTDPALLVLASADDAEARAGTTSAPWWRSPEAGGIAYVLFTSGSTGRPKGVPISYDNLAAFVDNMGATIAYRPDDVCSQCCELSFDVSAHEIYLALLAGCTLCPARRTDLYHPAHFIASRSITVWTAVPSLARVTLDNRVPVGDSLARLRVVAFNGEALTDGVATALHRAAPNASIWNTYGPTECTVAVTTHPWSAEGRSGPNGVVSLGRPFPDCRTALLDGEDIVPTTTATYGRSGELLLATPQRFAGYVDPALPAPFTRDADGTVYYRTGDRALWRADGLHYLGRLDQQVKIGGHRIELLETERRLRRFLGTESLAVVAGPKHQPTELVLFCERPVDPSTLDPEALGLPRYMVPTKSVSLERLPTSAHGKLDRAALQTLFDTAA